MNSTDLRWMEAYLRTDWQKIQGQIARLCAVRGRPDLTDEVVSEAMLRACKRNDYDPRKAAFSTYVLMLAKGFLGEFFSGQYLAYRYTEHELVDDWEPFEPVLHREEGGPLEWVPTLYRCLSVQLDGRDRACFDRLLELASQGRPATLKRIGEGLNCSPPTAAKALENVRETAKDTIKWTTALDRLSQHWADTRTFW